MRRVPVSEIMSTPVTCTSPDASVHEAVRTLRRHGISGVPVVDEDSRLLGMLTEADILRKEAGGGGLSELAYAGSPFGPGMEGRVRKSTHCVADLMSKDTVTITEDRSAREVASLMIRHGINRVPVVRDGKIVGIVTRADILSLFDRAPGALLAEAQRILSEDLLIDPAGFDIVVRDGTITIKGAVEDPRDVHLIHSFLSEMDGVVAVDTSELRATGDTKS